MVHVYELKPWAWWSLYKEKDSRKKEKGLKLSLKEIQHLMPRQKSIS